MTTTAPPPAGGPKGGATMKQTERIEAPMAGPGRGPMAGGMVGQKAATFKASTRRLMRRMAPERNRVLGVIALAVGSAFLLAYGPRLLGQATDLVFDAFLADRPVDFDAVRATLLQVVAVYVGGSLLAWGQGYVLNDVVQGTVRRMRSDVEDKVNALPLEYFDKQPRGELMSRVTNDIDNISQTLQQTMSQLLTSLLTVLAVLSMMFWISPLLALIALVSVPISMLVTSRIMKRSQGQFIAQWRRTGQLNAHIEESFSGHALVSVFGRRAEVERQFAEQNDALYEASYKAQFVSGLIMPVMFFVGNLNYVVVAVVGGLRVTQGTLTLGEVQAFIHYSRTFMQPLTQIASMVNLLQSGVASAERVFELLDAEVQVPDSTTVVPPAGRGEDRRSPSSVRRAPARPRWSTWSCASTSSTAGGSRSTGSTSPRCQGLRCADGSGWCSRTPGCSTARSGTTSSTAVPTRPRRSCSRRRGRRSWTGSCTPCPTATTRSWRRTAATSPRASVSCSPSRGPSSPTPPC
jgi:ATP-binding cassette subfamily B multidrug efflux pump